MNPYIVTPDLNGEGLHIGIVRARFNESIGLTELEACLKELEALGVDERDVTVRTIHGVELARHDQRRWSITIEGTAFLYNMVRILVGTLVDVARGHSPEGTIAKALASKDRAHAGQTAPPEGLVLRSIDVDFSLLSTVGEPWPR